MNEIAMTRKGHALVPVDEISSDALMHVPGGKEVLVTVRAPRNPRQHRLAWALAQKVSEACDWLPDAESAMDWLKIRCRHVRIVHNPATGHSFIVPKSIAFASLNQQSFSRLLNRMVYVICSEIVPGLSEADLRSEIEAMVNPAPQHVREVA